METHEIEKYYNIVADKYDSLYIDPISISENNWVYKKFSKMLNSFNDNVTVLDLGCGTGLGYEFLLKHSLCNNKKHSYIGIDISNRMVSEAQQKWLAHSEANFIVREMSDLSFLADESVDIVTSFFGSFSHTMNSEKTLSEIFRVLKPNGQLFLMTYSRFSLREIFNFIFRQKLDAFNIKKTYNIRNSGEEISCEALFYSSNYMKKLLIGTGFKKINFLGLNLLLEESLVKTLIKNTPLLCHKWLSLEQFVLYFIPDLGHSLVTIVKK